MCFFFGLDCWFMIHFNLFPILFNFIKKFLGPTFPIINNLLLLFLFLFNLLQKHRSIGSSIIKAHIGTLFHSRLFLNFHSFLIFLFMLFNLFMGNFPQFPQLLFKLLLFLLLLLLNHSPFFL